eukprot:CAMPEP_0172471514 /NCGR_PEP_ID=MMETSP1065-20121228/67856_1 /TAXON_ID=265537 /ORGANISM="Amphiprora paludosa, Strain CCMP125" /LENGTH=399 /DNA_ID=CAMNT_0013229617 /DNA_START=91 /DNA_END=1290 /DNA_ORIENTATION=-
MAQVRLKSSAAGGIAGGGSSAAASGANFMSGVTVSLDQPLMPPTNVLFTGSSGTAAAAAATRKPLKEVLWQALQAMAQSNVLKVAVATFGMALIFSLSLRFLLGSSASSKMAQFSKLLQGRLERWSEKWRPSPVSEPMPFEDENEGWGVCTLRARKRLGKTQFMQFDFELPQPEYTVPLDLGQQVSLCCLDNDGNVARGNFFPFTKESPAKPGSFSILAPNIDDSSSEETIFRIGLENANFVRVIKNELKIGDEVALTPGSHRLSYKGQYLPVTDMVYVAYGTGIVPVLDQIRSVLPSGASSVSSVTVVWINDSTQDFDVVAELLEKEYFKYSEKLAVSCIVGKVQDTPDFSANDEINTAIPDFLQGTMAVLAGPKQIIEKATFYLEDRGYPADTICTL